MILYGYTRIGPSVKPAWFHTVDAARRFASALGCAHAIIEERQDYAVDANDICDLPYGTENAPEIWHRQPAGRV